MHRYVCGHQYGGVGNNYVANFVHVHVNRYFVYIHTVCVHVDGGQARDQEAAVQRTLKQSYPPREYHLHCACIFEPKPPHYQPIHYQPIRWSG